MTIHDEHPFTPAESGRSPARRFRSRLASPVTLWTAAHQGQRAGLTVSSLLVADGDPGLVVGILDPLSDLWDALRASGRAVISVLDWPDRSLADAFGYVAPAPGGPFTLAQWTESEWGPRLAAGHTWAGCQLLDVDHPTAGWGILVRLEIAHVELGPDAPTEQPPLVHRRGRYSAAD
ncbi:MAG: flavin reductase domain protein FMN-binding protein [Frankiales bacterium]|nr:flavin reductase domain protein FMN-binding protein [Frankiales bacterium]